MIKKTISILFLSLCCISVWADVVINATTFPDANFRAFIMSKIAGASDGKLTNSELAKVIEIKVANSGVSDLTGIEYFTSLKRLFCAGNNLEKLDVSANKQLVILSCYDNRLTGLDVSQNTLMDTLFCRGNQIESIDLGALKNLSVLSIYSNKLKDLDISKNSKLVELYCQKNKIQELFLDNNVDLKVLNCSFNNLLNLAVEKNVNLQQLSCAYNSIGSLNLNQNVNLEILNFAGNRISGIDVTRLTKLSELDAQLNELENLDISKNKLLSILQVHLNQLIQLNPPTNTIIKEWDYHLLQQNIVLPAILQDVDGEKKYVISMPDNFVDKASLRSPVGFSKVSSLNGKNGTYFVIDPSLKPNFVTYYYDFGGFTEFAVKISVNYNSIIGDVNGDGTLDVSDVTSLINEILE